MNFKKDWYWGPFNTNVTIYSSPLLDFIKPDRANTFLRRPVLRCVAFEKDFSLNIDFNVPSIPAIGSVLIISDFLK